MHRFPQLGLEAEVVPDPGGHHGPAHSHDLGDVVGFRLEQDRVHLHSRFYSGGLGLHRLGPSNLAAVPGHVGVVGHVLGLEGGHAKTVLAKKCGIGAETRTLFPTWDAVPCTINTLPRGGERKPVNALVFSIMTTRKDPSQHPSSAMCRYRGALPNYRGRCEPQTGRNCA